MATALPQISKTVGLLAPTAFFSMLRRNEAPKQKQSMRYLGTELTGDDLFLLASEGEFDFHLYEIQWISFFEIFKFSTQNSPQILYYLENLEMLTNWDCYFFQEVNHNHLPIFECLLLNMQHLLNPQYVCFLICSNSTYLNFNIPWDWPTISLFFRWNNWGSGH